MPKQVDQQAQLTRIVQATSTVLATHGIDGLNLRAVAQEVGCTTGLIMHWFASKADLIQAALTHTLAAQNERVARHLAEHPLDVLGAIEEFLPIDEQRQAESRIWIAFIALAMSTPTLLLDHQQRYAIFRQEIIDHLKEINFQGAPLVDVADRILALVDGICAGATLDPSYWTPKRQRTVLATNIVDVIEFSQRAGKQPSRRPLPKMARKS